MLIATGTLQRNQINATDGPIGHVTDLYFEDQSWHVRYLVVETGSWLNGRQVLLSPRVVTVRDPAGGHIEVELTRQQVRSSPSAETEQPVSRQYEAQLHAHYGWPIYWGGAGTFGAGGFPSPLASGVVGPAGLPVANEPLTAPAEPATTKVTGDPHLRSVGEVRDYGIEAEDGGIGHVDDFLLDPVSWKLRYLVVDTRNWWPGRSVVVAAEWVSRISWDEQAVHVNLTRDEIKRAPEYDPSRPFDRESAKRLHDHYRRPHGDAW